MQNQEISIELPNIILTNLINVIPEFFDKFSALIIKNQGFLKICSDCGYVNNPAQMISDICQQIKGQIDPNSENTHITLFSNEWLVIHAFVICFKSIFKQMKNELEEQQLISAFPTEKDKEIEFLELAIFFYTKIIEEIEIHFVGVPKDTLLM